VDTRWIIRRRASPYTEFQLFCFPYAGGSATAYRRWPELAPRTIQVCGVEFPGRGARVEEPPVPDLLALVGNLADLLQPLLDVPYAFFGHSMGGLVAFELARALRERSAPPPRHLFISATAAPGTPSRRRSLKAASDAEVLEELRDLGGTSQELLNDADLMSMALPALRADYTALGSYRHRAAAPLDMPFTVFGGRRDPIAPPADLDGWRRHTTAGCRIELFPGDHFYLHNAGREILRTIAAGVGPRAWPERSTEPHTDPMEVG
jgi:medium-chain acyl-[acyl-carrier-protein] hydrolase